MRIEDWVMIAVIITPIFTLLAPILAVLIQHRLNKRKPEANQKDGWLKRIFLSPRLSRILNWACLFSILVNIYLIIHELLQTTPLTRISVLIIALAVAGIFYNIISLTYYSLSKSNNILFDHTRELFASTKELSDLSKKNAEVGLENAEIGRKLLEIEVTTLQVVKSLSDSLETTNSSVSKLLSNPALEKTSDGLLDKLQAQIKKLFGD